MLIVDDHAVVQWGFKVLLGQPALGRALRRRRPSPRRRWTRPSACSPDVALVDLFLGERSGAELCEAIRGVSPQTRVLLISGVGWISPAGGEDGRAPRGSSPRTGAPTRWRWRCAWSARGMTVFGRQEEGPATPLSSREREVLALIASGATNREIAERLYLSPHTVKEHASSLYRKLGVKNRAEAARRAERLGLTR